MSECIFCQLPDGVKIFESQHFFAVWDIDPIQVGHLLLISKVHHQDLRDLTEDEVLDFHQAQLSLIEQMEKQAGVRGLTLVINNGQLMDEGTHFHCHLIPRFPDDQFWETLQPEQGEFDKERFENSLGY